MVTKRILVVGEALIDIVDGVEMVGGSPANVALGLGRLGAEVELLTALARDERGARIARHLSESGVTVRPESYVLERTSTAQATLQADGSAEYGFDLSWEVAETSVDDVDIVHVGSIACVLEPGASDVRRIVERAAERGARVTFDPNIRPTLVGDPTAAERVREIVALSTLVKLSEEDAAALHPGLSLDDVAGHILARGPELVVITRGGDGAVLTTGAERVDVSAPQTTVVDTVGAGDTFMAALIASTAQRTDLRLSLAELEDLGAYCAAAAAITVRRAGADLPTSQEVASALA